MNDDTKSANYAELRWNKIDLMTNTEYLRMHAELSKSAAEIELDPSIILNFAVARVGRIPVEKVNFVFRRAFALAKLRSKLLGQ